MSKTPKEKVKKGVKDYTINKEEKVKEQTCSLIAIALLSGIGDRAPQGPLRCETKLVIQNRKQDTNMIAIKCYSNKYEKAHDKLYNN